MGLIVTTPETTGQVEAHRVWIRQRWSEEWILSPYLYCREVRWTASPTVASAELEWRYGEIQQAGTAFFAETPPTDLTDWYVCIEIAQTYDESGAVLTWKAWYGVIVDNGDNPQGARRIPDEEEPLFFRRIATGHQAILAYGMEHLLDRQPIVSSWYRRAGDYAERELGRALVFNDDLRAALSSGVDSKKHLADYGNRSPGAGNRGAYLFTGSATDGTPWTPGEIVRYLLAYHSPTDQANGISITFAVDPARSDLLPLWGNPIVRMEGRTVKNLLDELLDRRRLMGYTVEVEPNESETGERVLIRPFTFAETWIQLTTAGAFVAANPSQTGLDFDLAIDVESAHLKDSTVHLCDQVVARGARIVCCGTISSNNGTFIDHWTSAQETAYIAAASGVAGYAGWEEHVKEERNAVARAADHLKQVWSYFGLPAAWDGKVADGREGDFVCLFPWAEFGEVPPNDLGIDTTADNSQVWYPPGLEFIPRLPLKTHHDYSGSHIDDADIPDTTPAASRWEYREPLVLIQLEDDPALGEERFAEIDKLSAAARVETTGAGDGRKLSCSVSVNGPDLILKAHGESGQHTLAGAEFTPLDPLQDYYENVWDWKTIIATIALEADRCVEVRYPAELSIPPCDVARVLRIDAGSRAGFHYVAPGTVVAIENGALVRTALGGVIRDDRDLLSDLARVAYEWFGVLRQALTLTYRQAYQVLSIGDLITTIGCGDTLQDIRTVVTEIRVAMSDRADSPHRTTIQTQWAELDVLRLL